MDFKEIFNEKYIIHSDYYDYIRGKDVILVTQGSNSVYVPNSGDFINSFDVVAGAGDILKIQKMHPQFLGNRMDVLYRPGSVNKRCTNKACKPYRCTCFGRPASRRKSPPPPSLFESKNLKYFMTKLPYSFNPKKFHFKSRAVPLEWSVLLKNSMFESVSNEHKKKYNSGPYSMYHLLLHKPKSLYIMGSNFFLYGDLKGYPAKYNEMYKKWKYLPLPKHLHERYPKHESVNYEIPKDRKKHGTYVGWKATKAIYDTFDNVDGDPMFKDIMSMSDEEFKELDKQLSKIK